MTGELNPMSRWSPAHDSDDNGGRRPDEGDDNEKPSVSAKNRVALRTSKSVPSVRPPANEERRRKPRAEEEYYNGVDKNSRDYSSGRLYLGFPTSQSPCHSLSLSFSPSLGDDRKSFWSWCYAKCCAFIFINCHHHHFLQTSSFFSAGSCFCCRYLL